MINAVGDPQKILLLGGASEIGLAIVREYLAHARAEVVLALRPGRDRDALAAGLRGAGARDVSFVDFDAERPDTHADALDQAWSGGDVDVAIVAFGVLGDQERLWQDQPAAVEAFTVNTTAAVSVGVLLGQKMTAQGYGQIVAISSVAGVKIRRSNFVYGATKAGMDGFYTGLAQALEPAGVHVLVVRPGQVRTRMTAGLKEAPLTVDADEVGRAVYEAARRGKTLIWTPRAFEFVMTGLQHVPAPIFKRLPL